MFPSHGAGKGSAERSPGWRKNYDNIDWPLDHYHTSHDFRKTYGTPAPKRLSADSSDWRSGPTDAQRFAEEMNALTSPVEPES